MNTNTTHSHLLHRLIALLVTLSLLTPPLPLTAAPATTPAPAPVKQAAGNGLIVGEVYHDLTGLPVADATVTLLGVDGAAAQTPVTTDARGRYRLPAPAGATRLRVAKPGYTSVERTATATANRWVAALDARLTMLDPSAVNVPSVLGGAATNANGRVRLQIPAGSLDADADVLLTEVSAQALAGLPPAGWSPVSAAQVTPGNMVFQEAAGFAPTLSLPLPAGLPANALAVAARWDEAQGQWIALGQTAITPAQTQAETPIDRPGQFAFFLPDPAPNAPTLPVPGQPLAGVTPVPTPADLTAEILPSPRVIFTAPGERAQVTVQAASASAMSSGELLAVTRRESFDFSDGAALHPEPNVQEMAIFIYPGEPTAPAARFIVAPSFVAEPHALRLGTIDLAVYPHTPTGGALIPRDGATRSAATGEEIVIPRRAGENLPMDFSGLGAADFPAQLPTGFSFITGFAVDFFGARLALPGSLTAPMPTDLPASAQVVAVRMAAVDNATRLELVGPVTLSNGRLRFNGLVNEGRYAFIRNDAALGFVNGMVTGGDGRALAGAVVSIAGQPFVSLSSSEGRYIVSGPAGVAEVTALDPASYDSATASAMIGAANSFVTLNLKLAALPPSIVGVTPADATVNTPLTATVQVVFSEPVVGASAAFSLTAGGAPVSGAASLSPDGRTLTFRPSSLLASDALHTVNVAASVTDKSGNPLSAAYTGVFTTVDVTPPPPPIPGQVNATIPGDDNVSIVTGSPGTAETGALVRVRNLRNSADTTVLAEDDGSFRLEVAALRSDKLRLFLKDGAGNETEIPLPRFQNPDGSVVIGSEGGVVEAADGSFAEVAPGSLPDGAVIKVTPVVSSELPITVPASIGFVGGVRLELSEGVTPTRYIDLGVPAPPDAREDDIVLVMTPITLPTGAHGWNLIDRAHLEDGKFVTASPPFPGAGEGGVFSFFRPAHVIEPGPDGILQTEPRFASDDVIETRPSVNGDIQVVAPGPDEILQTNPKFNSDDVRRTECMSYMSILASYKFEIMIFSPTMPFIIIPKFEADRVTLVGFCNQPIPVTVSDWETGAVLDAVSYTAPLERNEILYPGAGLTDDHDRPTVIGALLPTQLIEPSPELLVKFSEAMLASSLTEHLKVVDETGSPVAGATEVLFRNTVALFRPKIAFRLGVEYTIQMSGVVDLAYNPVQLDAPLAFRRAAPSVIGELRSDPALFDALARCENLADPSTCYYGPQDGVTVGKTMFLANGAKFPYEKFKDATERDIAVLDVSDPLAPRIIGWYDTTYRTRAVAVLPDVAFDYTDANGGPARFEGDLMLVSGGGVGGQDNARLEIFDVTQCFQRATMENCLEKDPVTFWPRLGMKFLSTGMNLPHNIGVPPDPGSGGPLSVLHQRLAGPGGRNDTVVAYVVVVPLGLVAVDVTNALNEASASPSRFAIDGLYRGDFFDVNVAKTLVIAGENPGSGVNTLRIFNSSLQPLEEVRVPRAFRVASATNLIFDIDRDGNQGAGEDNDNDSLTGREELFDIALVASGGIANSSWGRGEIYFIDLSARSGLEHDEPLTEYDNLPENERIVSRIPLPGPAYGVCVDSANQLAYAAIGGVGVAVLDLAHILGVIRNETAGRWLIDDNLDFIDDRILYIFANESDPLQWLNSLDCQEIDLTKDPNASNDPAYEPAPPGTVVLNWEETGTQILGAFDLHIDSPVVMRSDFDAINQTICQAPQMLRFFVSHPATVTVTIGGQPMLVDEDFVETEDDGVDEGVIPLVNLPLRAGPHAYAISPDAVRDTGEHDFTVSARFVEGDPGVVMSKDGVIRHDLAMKANLPLGHTMVKGVDLWDGHLAYGSQDLTLPGRGLGLEFSRSYGSGGVQTDGPLGAGWTHNYNVRLILDNCGRYVVVGGEGSGNAFTNPHSDPDKAALFASPAFTVSQDALFYDPQIGYHSTLIRNGENANIFDFFTPSHQRYRFEREGGLAGEVYTLRFIEDTSGNRIILDYTSGDSNAATLDKVSTATGQSIRFEYEQTANERRIVKLTGDVGDPDLAVEVIYDYDTLGNLVAVTRTSPYAGFQLNDVRVNRYGYSVNNPIDPYNMVSSTDPDGQVIEYEYYAMTDAIPGYTVDFLISKHEFIKEIRQPEGVSTRFVYTLSVNPNVPNTRSVSDPRPGVPPTVYTLNSYGATTRVDAPLGKTTYTIWCTDLPLPAECQRRDALKGAEIDPLGRKTVYTYDELGNMTSETVLLNGISAAHIRPTQDADGDPVAQISTQYVYDPLFSAEVKQTDAEGNVTWTCLDSPTPPPSGSPCQPTSGRTGNVLATVDALGFRTSFAYDAYGNLLSQTDARGFTTSYLDHNALGLPQRMMDPLGNTINNVYDARGRLVEIWDTFGRHTTYGYDGLDRKVEERKLDDLGENGAGQIMRFLYSPGGQLLRTTNGLNHVSENVYDDLGRVVKSIEHDVLQADGSTVTYSTTLVYDEASNRVSETDARGVTRVYAYDALSRMTRSELVQSGVDKVLQSVVYDLANNKLSDTDKHGFVKQYHYDGLYRVVEEVLPFQHSFSDVPFQQAKIIRRYNLLGHTVSQTDANGVEVAMQYDDLYRMTHVTDPMGGVVVYVYDAVGNKTGEDQEVTGAATHTAYDALGRITSVTQTVPFGGPNLAAVSYVTSYSYEDADNAVVVSDDRGVKSRADKDGLDRLYQETNDYEGLNQTTTYFYDANGNVVRVRDGQGNDDDVIYTFDGLNRKIRVAFVQTNDDPGPVEDRYFYDGVGNLTRQIDARGIERRYTYDSLNRPLTEFLVESITNGGQELILGQTSYVDEAGADQLYQVTSTDVKGNQRVTFYDALNRPKRIADLPDAGVVEYEYDNLNMRARTDKRGIRSEFIYDEAGRQTHIVEFDENGVERSTIHFEFDDANLRTIVTDRRGIVTTEQRDGLGRLVQLSRSGLDMSGQYGAAEVVLDRSEYDAVGNLIRATDANGNVTEFIYDGLNRLVEKTDGLGSLVEATSHWAYDLVGNVLTQKDGRVHGGGFDMRYTYDARYRRISAENALGEITIYHYDVADNLVRAVEPKGPLYATEYRYDELGALLAVDELPRADATTPAGVTRFFYDAARNRIAQQDASGNLVTFKYDRFNRLTDMIQHTVAGGLAEGAQRGSDPTGALLLAALGNEASALHWRYEYDVAGNKTLIGDPRGQQVVQGYDYLSRLTSKLYQDHAAPALDFQPQTTFYAYDGNGNMTAVTETKQLSGAVVSEVTTFIYDPLDRVQSRTRKDHDAAVGKTIAYDYDLVGNRTKLTDADGVETAYAYDARNRLIAVTAETGVTTYSWWEDNLLKGVVYPNDTLQDLGAINSYDRADRMVNVVNTANLAALPFSTFAYEYDANGNRTQQVETQLAIGGGQPMTTTYSYDHLNRLIGVNYGAGNQLSYTYAENGNRLSEVGRDPLTSSLVDRDFVYDALTDKPGVTFAHVNTLTRMIDNLDAAQTVTYEYDRNLNQTAKVQGGQRNDYRFDIRDQIVAADAVGGRVIFDYDFARMRVKKIAPGAETRYLYDAKSVLQEYGGEAESHASQRKYDYGYRLLSLTEISGATRDSQFYLMDGLGSTSNLTDEAGQLVQSLRYDAWGRTLVKAGASQNPRQYTGHYFDAETGLHYFGARYYDAEIGRFLSQDPYLGEANTPPSLHRYLYAYANPLRFIDLTGYSSEEANSSSGDSQVQYSGQATTVRRGGYYSITATGSKAQAMAMAEWVNMENKEEPMNAASDVRFSKGHPASWAYAADAWAKETVKDLEGFVQDNPGMLSVLGATAAATGAELLAGFADALRFGEGIAEWWETGSVGALFQDAFRAADVASTLLGMPKGVSKAGAGVKNLWRSMDELAEKGWFSFARTVKRVGLKHTPVAMSNNLARAAYAAVAKDRYVFATRAVDPMTRWNANRLADLGHMPKDTSVTAKTVAGRSSKVVELPASKRQVEITIHGDDDFAWVYDKKRGRYLTEDEFEVEIRQPVNRLLPPSYHLQHGAQSTVKTYYMRKLNNDMNKVLEKTAGVGHVGPVVEMEWDAQGRMMTRSFSAEAAKGRFSEQGWFWNPAWDETKTWAKEIEFGKLKAAAGNTAGSALGVSASLTMLAASPLQATPARIANMYVNVINEK